MRSSGGGAEGRRSYHRHVDQRALLAEHSLAGVKLQRLVVHDLAAQLARLRDVREEVELRRLQPAHAQQLALAAVAGLAFEGRAAVAAEAARFGDAHDVLRADAGVGDGLRPPRVDRVELLLPRRAEEVAVKQVHVLLAANLCRQVLRECVGACGAKHRHQPQQHPRARTGTAP